MIIHLAGAGFSGRAVKLRKISPTEHDAVNAFAARDLKDQEATQQEFVARCVRRGLCRSIVAVTPPVKTIAASGADGTIITNSSIWIAVTEMELLEGTVPEHHYDRLFNLKDDALLASWWRRYADVTMAEVNEILGKAILEAGVDD